MSEDAYERIRRTYKDVLTGLRVSFITFSFRILANLVEGEPRKRGLLG